MVTISGPADLAQAIRKAKEVEMARNLAFGGQHGQKAQQPFRRQMEVSTRKRPIQCSSSQFSAQWNATCTSSAQPNKWLPRMYNIRPVAENKMPNAIIAAGMVNFIGNVLLHHDPLREVEDRIVVVGTPEDAEEVTEEGAEVVEEDHNSQLEPLWSRRDQMHLDRKYSRTQVHPECLVLILREWDRETSCALSWTAKAAEGTVGLPGAS